MRNILMCNLSSPWLLVTEIERQTQSSLQKSAKNCHGFEPTSLMPAPPLFPAPRYARTTSVHWIACSVQPLRCTYLHVDLLFHRKVKTASMSTHAHSGCPLHLS